MDNNQHIATSESSTLYCYADNSACLFVLRFNPAVLRKN